MSGIGQNDTALTTGRHTLSVAGGLQIGKYEIVRLLGRGGMGAVYQAFDPALERAVALKVMLPETAGDPEHKQRFEREARAIARLSHPAVVTVFDLGYHTDGSPYIVLELLRGTDLLARLRDGTPLSLGEKISIVGQVLDGLGHAHKAGIVHRDVKPANVFLTEEGSARITDFGIAFWTASGGTSRTVLGTVSYMSPEQVRGERVDGRSDLFSVGTLLCELLTGRRPFDAETQMATFCRIAQGAAALELPPGREYEGLLPVLRRALAPAVEERYRTAAEFAAALRACTGSGGATEAMSTADAKPAARRERQGHETPAPRADPSRLLRLLREIYVGGKSGHLHLAVAGERKSLRILKGQIVHGTSDKAGEHMGDVLVRYGLITQADLERAVPIVLRDRRRLGAVLGELGLLERCRVEEAVGLHAREILFNAIGRPGLTCAFEELADSLLETDTVCPFSTSQLILEATRRILDPDLVRTVLGDMGRVLVLSPDPQLRTQTITLTPADGFVLSRVDGNSSARDVMALVPLPAEDAERSLFSLLCIGIVDYRPATIPGSRAAARAMPLSARVRTPPTAPAAPPAPSPVPPAAPTAAPTLGGPAPVPAEAADRLLSTARSVQEVRALILETHAKMKRDHFEVLGLERTATEVEVREAYVAFARVLHPDGCRDSALADISKEREAVFIRLSEAYETLRSPASRAAYERAFEPSRLKARVAPVSCSSPRVASDAPAAPVSPAPVSPAPVSPAHTSATTPAAPTPTVLPGPRKSAVDARLMPDCILEFAEALVRDGQYWEAIQKLEPIIPRAEEPTRARAKMLLAKAYLKNPMWTKRAEGVLQSIVQDNPRHVAACLALAELYRDAGLVARARSLYRKVLELQPACSDAVSALGDLDPHGESAPPTSAWVGLFGRR